MDQTLEGPPLAASDSGACDRVEGFGGALDRANIALGHELLAVKSSLDVYRIIGLNASRIVLGTAFFGHLQGLHHDSVALGLAKVYEREKNYELCSVSGVHRLAKEATILRPESVATFTRAYGVEPSGDWVHDVDAVFAKQRPIVGEHLQAVNRARDTRIAHLQQNAPTGDMPSYAAFEALLTFAVAFRSFVSDCFLGTHGHPVLSDRGVAHGLVAVLEATGVTDVVQDFPA
jgi:hypothetical protein